MATWPSHISAADLFSSLSPPKRNDYIGNYALFLRRDLAADFKTLDLPLALDWAHPFILNHFAENLRLGKLGIDILVTAVDLFREPDVLVRLAGIILKCSDESIEHWRLSQKLGLLPDARRAIALHAMAHASNEQARRFSSTGVLVAEDSEFLLCELLRCESTEMGTKLVEAATGTPAMRSAFRRALLASENGVARALLDILNQANLTEYPTEDAYASHEHQ